MVGAVTQRPSGGSWWYAKASGAGRRQYRWSISSITAVSLRSLGSSSHLAPPYPLPLRQTPTTPLELPTPRLVSAADWTGNSPERKRVHNHKPVHKQILDLKCTGDQRHHSAHTFAFLQSMPPNTLCAVWSLRTLAVREAAGRKYVMHSVSPHQPASQPAGH